jgi:hypothetical protein
MFGRAYLAFRQPHAKNAQPNKSLNQPLGNAQVKQINGGQTGIIMTKSSYLKKAVIENAKWVDGVLMAGATISTVSIFAKLIGKTDLEVFGLSVSIEQNWIVLSIFTLIHLYVGWFLTRSVTKLWEEVEFDEYRPVYNEITTSGGIFVRGMTPRINRIKGSLGYSAYAMQSSDPSTWIAHVFAISLFISMIPFSLESPLSFVVRIIVAIVIVVCNWLIGSSWIVFLSDLTLPKRRSRIIAKSLDS